MTEGVNVSLDAAHAKWRAHWPEWEIAEIFLPSKDRQQSWAWFAWLDELASAAWSGADAAPGMAKLAWWQEELRGWAKGARRHPLGVALQSMPIDWTEIADQMGGLRERDLGVSGQIDALSRASEGFARAVAKAEHNIFGGSFAVAPERLVRTMMVSAGVVPDSSLGAGVEHGNKARRLLDTVADLRAKAPGKPIGRFALLLASWRAARSS